MQKKLERKVSIITGGAGFLGQQIFLSMIEMNPLKIIIIDNNLKNIKKFEKKFYKYKKYYAIYNVDITNEKEIKKVNDLILKKFKKIDILINNAAIDYKPVKNPKMNNNFFTTNIYDWNRDLSVSLTGTMLCCKIFTKFMEIRKKGIILNIASDLSVIAPDQRLYDHMNIIKPISYSVVKHGIIGLTKYLASYFAKKNIRVNALSPGGILNNQDKNFQKKIKKAIPMGRMAKKGEYIKSIKFLCSDDSSYLTGQNIIIDGGRSII